MIDQVSEHSHRKSPPRRARSMTFRRVVVAMLSVVGFMTPLSLSLVNATPAGASVTGCNQQWYGHVGPTGYDTPSFTVEPNCGGTGAYNTYTEDSSPAASYAAWWYDNSTGNWVEGTRGYVYTGSGASLILSDCSGCYVHAQSDSQAAYVYLDT
jgi:hypothetical protein